MSDDSIMPEDPQAKAAAEAMLGMAGVDGLDGGVRAHYSATQVRRARELLTRLYAVRRSARFYPIEHPAVREGVDALLATVRAYHEEGVDVQLTFYEGDILLGEQLLPEESVAFDQLIRDMTAIGAGSIIIRKGVDGAELARAARVLSSDAAEVEAHGSLAALLEWAETPHVEVGTVRAVDREAGAGTAEDAREAYGGALGLMREIDRLFQANRAVGSGKVKGVVKSLVDNVLGNRYAMLQLTGLKNYDEYTFFHSANVAILSLALGSMVTSDYRFLSSLGVGALLHDIGKLTVDLSILNKPGALSPDEWGRMRQHPVYGAEMTALIPGLDKSAIVTILEHHMRYDGTGYPERTPRRPQHLASRIVAIADAYDAMTSRRSYSAARLPSDAVALIGKAAGTSLDPGLARLFVSLMGVYPPRSVVRLSTGETGVVIQPNALHPSLPTVRVIAAAGGAMVTPRDIDLAEGDVRVSGCLDPRVLNIEVDEFV